MAKNKKIKLVIFDISAPTMSFRKPRYENFQASYPIPPKSMVVGMIAHAANRGERLFYRLLKDIRYSVVMLGAKGKFVDLWRAIQGKGTKGGERGIFYREKIFKPCYRIYLHSDNYLSDIFNILKKPCNIVYLGLSEDLIRIRKVLYEDFKEIESNCIQSMIPYSLADSIKEIVWEDKTLKINFPPVELSMIAKFKVDFSDGLRKMRRPEETIETINACGARFILKNKVKSLMGLDGKCVYLI